MMSRSNNSYGSIPSISHYNDDAEVSETVKKFSEKLDKFTGRMLMITGTVLAALLVHACYVAKDDHRYDSPHPMMLGMPNDKSYLLDPSLDEQELFYNEQYVDHINVDTEHSSETKTWPQRFYKKSKYWKKGGPILLVIGGEDSLDLPLLYPFVHEGLAREFGAFFISPEHRFYGKSIPTEGLPTTDEMIKYLTPDQALLDLVNIVEYVRLELGCNPDPNSDEYCPVITFGGSYPGFLSTMLRFRFPDIIDIGYASSAPLFLYSQKVDSDAYYDKITEVAEAASPGCAGAVRSTLFDIRDDLLANYTDVLEAAQATGFCPESFPDYMESIPEFISETITFLVPAMFADFNMFYYPPSPDSGLARVCRAFEDYSKAPMQRLLDFFQLRAEIEYALKDSTDADTPYCFDLSLELPDGPHARIRGADNSGSGGGYTGEIWEFQCCKDLIIRAGYSEESMFLPRHFDYTWHKEHCEERFPGVPVQPFRMRDEWHFDDLSTASRILFVNGLNDGWSTSSILETDNPRLKVINLENGAHHSELGPIYPNPEDTKDVVEGHEQIAGILSDWLNEIREA